MEPIGSGSGGAYAMMGVSGGFQRGQGVQEVLLGDYFMHSICIIAFVSAGKGSFVGFWYEFSKPSNIGPADVEKIDKKKKCRRAGCECEYA